MNINNEQATCNLQIIKGDTFRYSWKFLATSLEGYRVVSQWRDLLGDVAITCDSTANPKTMLITSGTNSTITPVITAEQTASLDGTYYYDIQIMAPDGTVMTPIKGTIGIAPDVTRLS